MYYSKTCGNILESHLEVDPGAITDDSDDVSVPV